MPARGDDWQQESAAPVLLAVVPGGPCDPMPDLEVLRRDLIEEAFLHDRRGQPAAAEAVLAVAGRLADLQAAWAARRSRCDRERCAVGVGS